MHDGEGDGDEEVQYDRTTQRMTQEHRTQGIRGDNIKLRTLVITNKMTYDDNNDIRQQNDIRR